MYSGNQQSGERDTARQWPDFYSILESSPEADSETLRRSINTLYVKANQQSDHRELNTRFYNQVLTQKVLPQCRRILLDQQTREAYNRQWHLHREGSEAALSYQEFVSEISKEGDIAGTLLLSDDEIGVLPGISSQSSQPTSAPPETLVTPETVASAQETVSAGPAVGETRKNPFPLVPAVAVLAALGIGGYSWNASRQNAAPETTPLAAPPVAASGNSAASPVDSNPVDSDGTFETMAGWGGIDGGKSIVEEGGNHFLRFVNENPAEVVQAAGQVALDPKWKRVTMSAKMRGTIKAKGKEGWYAPRITFQFLDAKAKMAGDWPDVLVLQKSSAQWAKVTRIYDVPTGATSIALTPGLWGTSGTFDIDDLIIKSADKSAAVPQKIAAQKPAPQIILAQKPTAY